MESEKEKAPPGARVFGLCEAFADGVRESPIRLLHQSCGAILECLERQDFSDRSKGAGPESHAQTGCILSDVPCSFPRNRGSSPDARSSACRIGCICIALPAAGQIRQDHFPEYKRGFPACSYDILPGSVCPALSVCGRGILHIRSKKFFCSHIFGLNNSGRLFFRCHDRIHGRQALCPDKPGTRRSSFRRERSGAAES